MLSRFYGFCRHKRAGALTLLAVLAVLIALEPVAEARRLIGDVAKSAFTFRPQALTATANGTAVDRLNYQSVLALLDVGAVAGTTPTLDCKLQESDTSGGTYTDLSPAVSFTQVTAANGRQEKSVDLSPKKRFVRGTCTVGGTGPSFTMSLIFVLGEPGASPLP